LDNLIKRFLATEKGDVSFIKSRGIAFQTDLSNRIDYDDAYIEKCKIYHNNLSRLEAVNKSRIDLVSSIYGDGELLDIGVGQCDFLDRRPNTWGHDIAPSAIDALNARGKYAPERAMKRFDAFSMWDVLEHLPNPGALLSSLPDACFLFVSIPVIPDLGKLDSWTHYKPGEHLYYFTVQGFIDYMEMYGFRCVKQTDGETLAGRVDIFSAAFTKDMPSYRDMIGQYEIMHQKRYGVTAADHLNQIGDLVRGMNPKSILDYGCGQSGFVNYFWNDGARRLACFDPAIRAYREMPEGQFDLVTCCDVMEHIEMRHVDQVLSEIRLKSKNAIFTIATKLARARLPDGRNAHVTLLDPEEWRGWIEEKFGCAIMAPTVHPKTVLVRTF